jgi:flagellar assembly protein FliH
MNTSFRRAAVKTPARRIEPLSYPEAPGSSSRREKAEASPLMTEKFEPLSAPEIAARLELARREGEAAAHAAFRQQINAARAQVEGCLKDFAQKRQQYFEQVEAEVVHLALSIARKILHRESSIDPQLLLGMVRVAIEQLEGATSIVIKVAPPEVGEWRNYFLLHLEQKAMPEVIGDPALDGASCRLETNLGATRLGIEPQIKEIETGLLDLMARKPVAP